MSKSALWIKNPLAIHTSNNQDAKGGIVIQHNKIIELVKQGQSPNSEYDQVFDAKNHDSRGHL